MASAAGLSACCRTRHSSARVSRPASRASRTAWQAAAPDDAHSLWITLWRTCLSIGWEGRAERSVSVIVLFNEMQMPYKSTTCFQFTRSGGRSGRYLSNGSRHVDTFNNLAAALDAAGHSVYRLSGQSQIFLA
jgi:hypothetical protein